MWAVFKIDKKRELFLSEDIKKKLGQNPIFYKPKMLLQNYKKNKLLSKEFSLLGDYVFCFHPKFNCSSSLSLLSFCRGLKYYLVGSISSQKEIVEFINKCKNAEDLNGNITTNFFKIDTKNNYKFKSGPMTDKLFKIINIQRNKLKILLGDLKTTINKKDYLFYPV